MSVIQGNAFSDDEVDTGDIEHSLRCRSAASAYLSRTFGTPTSNTVWTSSLKVKRGSLGSTQALFTAGSGGLWFNASNQLNLFSNAGGSLVASVAVFRDPTSHYFIDVASNGTTIKVYANGVEILSYTGTVTSLNSAIAHNIARHTSGANQYLDGYLSRICFVDGQALTPDSFGYLNTEINEWVTKTKAQIRAAVAVGGGARNGWGANGFMENFDDATSLTTLGYDTSQADDGTGGNHWTLNNFSLTAGTTYDHMLDVPGNSYATIGTLSGFSTNNVVTNGNLKHSSSAIVNWTKTHQVMATGKWYWEMIATTQVNSYPISGLWRDSATYAGSFVGNNANGVGYYPNDGKVWNNNVGGSILATYVTNDVIGFAFDADSGKFYVSKNGTWLGSADPAAGTNPALSGLTQGDWCAVVSNNATGSTEANMLFGQAPLHASATYDSAAGGYFRYTPPTGFKALCQANLPTPAILNPSSAVAHRFEAGSGIAAAIASDRSGWSDWMEWFKRTDTTESWKVRFSDDSGNMLAFDTNGAKAAWSAPSTGTYLGAAFKVGATYGVVTGTYSGDSTSNKNISHSLGKAPTCGIVKNESTGTWYVWHTKMTSAAYFTTLNSATPPAQSNTNTPWGTGNWSSTQFMVTNNATNNLNATGSTYRYILFADIDGLLALLGHTGNASTDGALEYVGHKAQIQIEKDLAATTGFYVWSDKIDTYNVTGSYLLLNTNAGIATATGVDIVSNAIKHRSATLANASNAHMDISYARVSGKYSLGR